PDPAAADPDAAMERTPPVFPALGHVVHCDDVETERRFVGVDGVCAVELLDALGEDVEQERELGLAADDHVSLECSARQWSGHSRRLQTFATPRCGACSAFARRPAAPAASSSVAPIAL